MVIATYTVRAAADATASTVTTAWAPCRGVRMVLIRWRATSSAQPTASSVEGTNLTPLAAGGSGWGTGGAQIVYTAGSVTANDLSARGGCKALVTPVVGALYLGCEGIRATLTVPIITGLECVIEVYYDDDSLIPVGSTAV